jgi:hypothetical protein
LLLFVPVSVAGFDEDAFGSGTLVSVVGFDEDAFGIMSDVSKELVNFFILSYSYSSCIASSSSSLPRYKRLNVIIFV